MAGRPPTYQSDDERPVTVSLRVPKDLHDQAQQYAGQRRMTLTELLLDGLKMRLETPADPRELLSSDESNTVIQQLREELKDALLEELRKDVQGLLASTVQAGLTQSQHTALPLPTHDIQPPNHAILYGNGNTVLQERSPQPDFDPVKYRLGTLCPQGHDYQGSGQSLRRREKGDCVECGKLAKRQKRQLAKVREEGLL